MKINDQEYAHHIMEAQKVLQRDFENRGFAVKLGHVTPEGHVVDVVAEKKSNVHGIYIVVAKDVWTRGEDKSDGREDFGQEMKGKKIKFRCHVHNASATPLLIHPEAQPSLN